MKLVEIGEDKIPELAQLWYSLAKEMEEYSDLNSIVYDEPSEVSEEGFRRQIESDNYSSFLLRENGKDIGFVTLKEGEHPSRKHSDYLRIVNLFIREEYRNRGCGSAVIEAVKEIARDKNSDYLKVSSEWYNEKAREFYTENGFEEKQVEFVQKLD